MVKLVHGLHHGCLGGDHGCPVVVKLMMGLHHGSPMVVKLEVGLHRGGYIRKMRCSGVVKLVMGLHHQRYENFTMGVPRSVRLVLEPHHMDSHTHVSR